MNISSAFGNLLLAVTLTGCASMNESRSTATGTGIGPATGAAIGALVGGGKGAAIGATAGATVGAGGGILWSNQKQVMEQATAGTGVAVTQTADNHLKLEIPSGVSFDTSKADIRPCMRPVLDRFSQTLTANSTTTIRIIGHTDSTGTDAVCNPLSVSRASTIRDYLIGRGAMTNRIAIDGRGAREPVADNGTQAGRENNRRVEIFVADAGPVPPVSEAPY